MSNGGGPVRLRVQVKPPCDLHLPIRQRPRAPQHVPNIATIPRARLPRHRQLEAL